MAFLEACNSIFVNFFLAKYVMAKKHEKSSNTHNFTYYPTLNFELEEKSKILLPSLIHFIRLFCGF